MTLRRPPIPSGLFALVSALAAIGFSLPPWRGLIEQSMVWHMAVQMPMLVVAGWCMAGLWRDWRGGDESPAGPVLATWDRYGLTSFLLAQGVLSYWMLPSAIDRAVVLPLADLTKLLTLFGCGALLQRAVAMAPAALQVFGLGYGVSMLWAAGSFVAAADRRLCNAYTMDSQVRAGMALVLLGAIVGAAGLLRLWQVSRRALNTHRVRPDTPRSHPGP